MNNIAAGREYVEAYVSYIHYVERLWKAAAGGDPHDDCAERGAGEHAHAAHVH